MVREIMRNNNPSDMVGLMVVFIIVVIMVLPIPYVTSSDIVVEKSTSGPVHNVDKGTYYQTIQAGIDDADPHNSIIISNGTYNESILINKPLNISGNSSTDTIIIVYRYQGRIRIEADNVNISNICVEGVFPSTIGIHLFGVTNCSVHNIFVKNIGLMGIQLEWSDNNVISNCIIVENRDGCSSGSQSNVIKNCRIINNSRYGIIISGHSNIIHSNEISNNSEVGIYTPISKGTKGRFRNPWSTTKNVIVNNQICMNSWGAYVYWQPVNGTKGSSEMPQKMKNIFYHNSFINNTVNVFDQMEQIWNMSYPIGGNYWSDYIGQDLFSGPDQTVTGSDCIGDTPYLFNINQDNYPLMNPIDYIEYNISLQQGWNLISIPSGQLNNSVDAILENIASKWNCIQMYDSIESTWKSYNIYQPDSLNELHDINHKMGFWINITEPNVTLTVTGYLPATTTIPLYAGWNLVGYPTMTEEIVANALWGTGADKVEVFDPAEPYRIREVEPTYLMKTGEGYWVHVPMDTTWIIDW